MATIIRCKKEHVISQDEEFIKNILDTIQSTNKYIEEYNTQILNEINESNEMNDQVFDKDINIENLEGLKTIFKNKNLTNPEWIKQKLQRPIPQPPLEEQQEFVTLMNSFIKCKRKLNELTI